MQLKETTGLLREEGLFFLMQKTEAFSQVCEAFLQQALGHVRTLEKEGSKKQDLAVIAEFIVGLSKKREKLLTGALSNIMIDMMRQRLIGLDEYHCLNTAATALLRDARYKSLSEQYQVLQWKNDPSNPSRGLQHNEHQGCLFLIGALARLLKLREHRGALAAIPFALHHVSSVTLTPATEKNGDGDDSGVGASPLAFPATPPARDDGVATP
jgi:hypothetical protein